MRIHGQIAVRLQIFRDLVAVLLLGEPAFEFISRPFRIRQLAQGGKLPDGVKRCILILVEIRAGSVCRAGTVGRSVPFDKLFVELDGRGFNHASEGLKRNRHAARGDRVGQFHRLALGLVDRRGRVAAAVRVKGNGIGFQLGPMRVHGHVGFRLQVFRNLAAVLFFGIPSVKDIAFPFRLRQLAHCGKRPLRVKGNIVVDVILRAGKIRGCAALRIGVPGGEFRVKFYGRGLDLAAAGVKRNRHAARGDRIGQNDGVAVVLFDRFGRAFAAVRVKGQGVLRYFGPVGVKRGVGFRGDRRGDRGLVHRVGEPAVEVKALARRLRQLADLGKLPFRVKRDVFDFGIFRAGIEVLADAVLIRIPADERRVELDLRGIDRAAEGVERHRYSVHGLRL